MEKFIIMMQAYDKKVTVEFDDSEQNIDDVIDSVVVCLRGLTFTENTIKEGMKEYLDLHEIS